MLGSCIGIVTTEINVNISELVQKMASIQYSPQIMTGLTVVRVGHNELAGVIAAVGLW